MTALDRQEAFSGTKEVPAALAFDAAALAAWLQPRVPDFRLSRPQTRMIG